MDNRQDFIKDLMTFTPEDLLIMADTNNIDTNLPVQNLLGSVADTNIAKYNSAFFDRKKYGRYKNEYFKTAVNAEDFDDVKEFLDADTNDYLPTDEDIGEAFLKLMDLGQEELAGLLIDRVKHVDWAMIAAAEAQNIKAVQFLFNKGVSAKNLFACKGLNSVLRNGNIELAKLMLDHNVPGDCEPYYAISSAAEGGHLDCVELLLDRKYIYESKYSLPLIEYSKLLLNDDYFTNNIGPRNALLQAAQKGYLDIASLLLDRGVPTNTDLADKALLLAAVNRHWKIVELLLDRGVELNTPKSGNAFEVAVEYLNKEIVKLFIDKGLDLNNEFNDYAANVAVEETENIPMIKLLIDNGMLFKSYLVSSRNPHIDNLLGKTRSENKQLFEALKTINLVLSSNKLKTEQPNPFADKNILISLLESKFPDLSRAYIERVIKFVLAKRQDCTKAEYIRFIRTGKIPKCAKTT